MQLGVRTQDDADGPSEHLELGRTGGRQGEEEACGHALVELDWCGVHDERPFEQLVLEAVVLGEGVEVVDGERPAFPCDCETHVPDGTKCIEILQGRCLRLRAGRRHGSMMLADEAVCTVDDFAMVAEAQGTDSPSCGFRRVVRVDLASTSRVRWRTCRGR